MLIGLFSCQKIILSSNLEITLKLVLLNFLEIFFQVAGISSVFIYSTIKT